MIPSPGTEYYNFVRIDLLDIGVLLSKRWPSEASNHGKNPLRGLDEEVNLY